MSRAEAKGRFLVLGCGSIGSRHIDNLLGLGAGEVLAFDVRPDRAETTRQRFGVETFTNLRAALDRQPRAVLVTAPTSLHVPLARQAAECGCHLFIEKPLSDSWDGVDELQELVRERRLVTLVGCNMRFHPGLRAIKALVREGAIGRVLAGRAEAGQYLPDWHPWEDYRQGYSARRDLGGGIILDAIHEIDYVRWLLGPVAAVSCFAGKFSSLAIQTEDTAALLLRFAGGAIGEVHLDYVQRVYSKTCHLIGEEGTIRWDFTAGEVRTYRAATRAWGATPNPVGWQVNQMYVDEMTHYLACLAGTDQPEQDVFEGARVLRVALAAKEAAATNRVVLFPEPA
jgi:predicted dehydrogenase